MYNNNPKINRDIGSSYPFKPSAPNSFNMVWNLEDAFRFICPNFLSYKFIYKCECGIHREKSNNIIVFANSENQKILTYLSNFNRSVNEIVSKQLRCNICKSKQLTLQETQYSDMIIVYPTYGFNCNNIETPLTDFPVSICPNKNDKYNLKFLVHFEKNQTSENDKAINHFICYAYDHNNNKYFCIDDSSQTDQLISPKNILIYAEFLCYFKQF
jgi:hypothetical protein